MPEYLSSDAKNLISRMLVVDPSKRIKVNSHINFYNNIIFIIYNT